MSDPEISVVIPVLDEQDSLEELASSILSVFDQEVRRSAEVIFVDDGSRDASWQRISELAARHPDVVGIRLRANFGKAEALAIGIERARGAILVTMDADLQDEPAEIPRFLEKLEDGFDLVVGWKKNRRDPLSKTLPSKLFNAVTGAVSGLRLKDFNCGFKAGRRAAFADIPLYGDLHRYIPALAHQAGYRVGQLAVLHHPRRFGKSKYGFERYARGFLDLLTVLALTRYARRPGHLFGGVGLVFGILGGGILGYLLAVRLVFDEIIGNRPLLLLGVMLTVLSVQFLLFGMLAEMNLSQTRDQKKNNRVLEHAGEEDHPSD